MNTTAHDTDGSGERELTHVGRLIRRYSNGRSTRQIERENGLNNGQLSRFASPDWDGNELSLRVMQRFVDALGAPMEEVSSAFARDTEIPLEGRALSPEEEELLDDYARVPPEFQATIRRMVKAARADGTTGRKVAARRDTGATT